MKTIALLSLLTGIALTIGTSAFAEVADLTGTWNGTVAYFSLHGDPLGTYPAQMVNTLQEDGSVISNSTVTESQLTFRDVRDIYSGFAFVSNEGSGHAVCYGGDLCKGYANDQNGNEVVFTLVFDTPDSFRVLTSERSDSQSLVIRREEYLREQPK